MNFPDRMRKFYFDYTNEYGERYEGYFTIKCRLTIRERHMMELEKTRLCGGYESPTGGLLGISVMLSNLEVKIDEAPEWWKQNDYGRDLEDENVIAKLFDTVLEQETQWREELTKTTKKAVEKTKKAEDKAEEEGEETPKGNG